MTTLPITADNRGLAAAVNGRIRSEAIMVAARALVWRLGAVGLLLLLIGAGAGLACYGYSYVVDSRTSYQQMATAFANALDHANLGRVRLEVPESTIKLDPTAMVHLDPAAMVHLDPQARITTVTTVVPDFPRPSQLQLNNGSTRSGNGSGDGSGSGSGSGSSSSGSNAKIVTNYTIFKTVPYGEGSISTGWTFQSSDQQQPSSQFCHYRQYITGDAGSVVQIAVDGQLVANGLKAHFGIDPQIAAQNCIWFDGRPTAA